jgi:hypothetical protein
VSQWVYVDCETTGLDRRRHDAYELSWAIGQGPIHTLLLPHRAQYADAAALMVGRYRERDIPRLLREQGQLTDLKQRLQDFVTAFRTPEGGKRTLVAANPNFDAGMLFGKVIGVESRANRVKRFLRLPAPAAPTEPWHYRLLDIEAYAAGVLGWTELKGLRAIQEHLTTMHRHIITPNHTSAGDVATLRGVHWALMDILAERKTS